jgi:hypothetical protein
MGRKVEARQDLASPRQGVRRGNTRENRFFDLNIQEKLGCVYSRGSKDRQGNASKIWGLKRYFKKSDEAGMCLDYLRTKDITK